MFTKTSREPTITHSACKLEFVLRFATDAVAISPEAACGTIVTVGPSFLGLCLPTLSNNAAGRKSNFLIVGVFVDSLKRQIIACKTSALPNKILRASAGANRVQTGRTLLSKLLIYNEEGDR